MSGALATALCLATYLCALHDPATGNLPKEITHRHKAIVDFMKRQQIIREQDLTGKDDTLDKRQELLFDDYGHMRFGKREESDDYGHLRYGRSGD